MNTDSNTSSDRSALRQAFRSQRRALDANQQRTAEAALAKQGAALLSTCTRITSYNASDGEIQTGSLTHALGGDVYLPVVNEHDEMTFVKHNPAIPLVEGRWGIMHPPLAAAEILDDLSALDAMLIPLVAFDRNGSRLGRGGGFYDKILSVTPRRVLRIGLAHHFQEHSGLPEESWDQKLDLIITDRELIDCRR